MFQIERNIAGGMKSLLGIFLQAVLHNPLQRRRNIAIGFVQLRRVFLQDRAHRIRGRFSVKSPFTRDHLEQNRPKTEYIGARIHRHAAHLLRRHIPRRAQHHARLRGVGHGGQRGVVTGIELSQFGQPKVQNLDPSILGEE